MLDTREWIWLRSAPFYSHCASGNYDRDLTDVSRHTLPIIRV
jgi:hypothetical protein